MAKLSKYLIISVKTYAASVDCRSSFGYLDFFVSLAGNAASDLFKVADIVGEGVCVDLATLRCLLDP